MTTTVPTLPARPDAAEPASSGPRVPRWPRLALTALLAATAVLYLWGLSRSGWANAFYSAAAQAGGESWKAWFFGSSDAANAITVDKTPAALWITGLSVRIFGLSSWSVLVPQALMGVATHIRKFWDPRMRRELLAYLDHQAGEGLSEVVLSSLQAHRSMLLSADQVSSGPTG